MGGVCPSPGENQHKAGKSTGELVILATDLSARNWNASPVPEYPPVPASSRNPAQSNGSNFGEKRAGTPAARGITDGGPTATTVG